MERTRAEAVSSRRMDFWLFGGASIALWLVMLAGQLFRGQSEAIENHFMQVGVVFSMMAIFCNHPHFMISYKLGYGRGPGFVKKHWFSLVAVPLALAGIFALAYFKFNAQIAGVPGVIHANSAFRKAGLDFRLGTLQNLGTEILSLSVLLMNLTVGWHYSKQVLGCILVNAHCERYAIDRLQRRIFKASLFSVAFFNFFYLSIYAPEYSAGALKESYFFNIPLVPLGLPAFLIPASAIACVLLALCTFGFVFYANYRKTGRWPSANLVVAWVAFHVWWIPVFRQTEYLLAVPFFHSLQYLPFAYRLDAPRGGYRKSSEVKNALSLGVLLFAGFAAFELVPSLLDRWLQSGWYFDTWFFMIAFAVFINVHHFFIDSVLWKFDSPEVRAKLLEARPAEAQVPNFEAMAAIPVAVAPIRVAVKSEIPIATST